MCRRPVPLRERDRESDREREGGRGERERKRERESWTGLFLSVYSDLKARQVRARPSGSVRRHCCVSYVCVYAVSPQSVGAYARERERDRVRERERMRVRSQSEYTRGLSRCSLSPASRCPSLSRHNHWCRAYAA